MAILRYEGIKRYFNSVPEAKEEAYKLVSAGKVMSIELHTSTGLSGVICMVDGRLCLLRGGDPAKAVRIKRRYAAA